MNTERHKYCLANIPTQEFISILTLHLSILYKVFYTLNKNTLPIVKFIKCLSNVITSILFL